MTQPPKVVESHVPSATRSVGRHIPALDGLRGIAIALVLVYHFDFVFNLEYGRESNWAIDGVASTFAGAGWAGVDLFFVLSGFLITGILIDSRTAARRYLATFYARRLLRIFPAYYVFLLLMLFVVLPAFDEPAAREALRDNFPWYVLYLSNFLIAGLLNAVNTGLRGDFLFVGHVWSLAVEEQFYLIWPTFVLVFNQRALVWVCSVGVVVALVLRIILLALDLQIGLSTTLAPARMDALALGALVSLAVRDPAGLGWLTRSAGPAAIIALVGIAGLGIAEGAFALDSGWVRTVGFTGVAVLFAATLAIALRLRAASPAEAALSNSALRWLGHYSYAIYLWHLPIAVLLARQIEFSDAIPALAGSTFPAEILFATSASAVAFLAAWLSWKLLESQFLKLKVRVPYATTVEPATAASAS